MNGGEFHKRLKRETYQLFAETLAAGIVERGAVDCWGKFICSGG